MCKSNGSMEFVMAWILLHAPNDEPLIVDILEMRVMRRPTPSEASDRHIRCTIIGTSRSLFVKESFEDVVKSLINLPGHDIYQLDGSKLSGVRITAGHSKKAKG